MSPVQRIAPGLLLSAVLCAQQEIAFNREVRPILSDKCFKCHGPDEKERKAGLRLDTMEGFMAPTDSGAAPEMRSSLRSELSACGFWVLQQRIDAAP